MNNAKQTNENEKLSLFTGYNLIIDIKIKNINHIHNNDIK